MEFIGEVIAVETEGVVKKPARFTWRGTEFQITRIIHSWHDYSMPTGLRKPKWTMRHHRNCYIVETDTHERFEIYFDRGKKRPDWVLLKHLGRVPTGESVMDRPELPIHAGGWVRPGVDINNSASLLDRMEAEEDSG